MNDGQSAVAAVNALYRIRGEEKAPDAEGIREVWHQCAQDVELISFVRDDGRVMRQEFTLLREYFQWTSTDGLRSGNFHDSIGGKTSRATERVKLDRVVDTLRVRRAAEALADYSGEDKYLLHIRKVLAEWQVGTNLLDEEMVTRQRTVSADERASFDLEAPPPAKARSPRWIIVAVGAAIAAAALVLVFH